MSSLLKVVGFAFKRRAEKNCLKMARLIAKNEKHFSSEGRYCFVTLNIHLLHYRRRHYTIVREKVVRPPLGNMNIMRTIRTAGVASPMPDPVCTSKHIYYIK